MEISIDKWVLTNVIVNAELPYYYEHDLANDGEGPVIYGKIEDDKCTTIEEYYKDNKINQYTFKIDRYKSIKTSNLACYFKPEYKLSMLDYELVIKRFNEFVKNTIGE